MEGSQVWGKLSLRRRRQDGLTRVLPDAAGGQWPVLGPDAVEARAVGRWSRGALWSAGSATAGT